MAQILVLKTGSVDGAVRDALVAAGIVPIEVDDPSSVRLISVEGPELSGSDLLYAALAGCQTQQRAKERFAETVMALLKDQRSRVSAKAAPAPNMPARDSKGRFLPPQVSE